MNSQTINLIGKTFGLLTVVEYDSSKRKSNHGSYWICHCRCGITKSVRSDCLRRKEKPTRSCGCLSKQIIPGPENSNFQGVGELPLTFWNRIINRAAKSNIPITITIHQAWNLFLSQSRKCALTGQPIVISNRGATASLDRIDNKKGYIKENVQWIHKHINQMKNIHDEKYFISLCEQIVNYGKHKTST